MTSIVQWIPIIAAAFAIIVPLVNLFYGDTLRTWRAQRSVEKMENRILQLRHELRTAEADVQSLPPFLQEVAAVVYLLSMIIPATMLVIMPILGYVFLEFAIGSARGSDHLMIFPLLYFVPYLVVLGLTLLLWRVFYFGGFGPTVKRMGNVADYNDFKVKAEKTITHLEGRIKRLEK